MKYPGGNVMRTQNEKSSSFERSPGKDFTISDFNCAIINHSCFSTIHLTMLLSASPFFPGICGGGAGVREIVKQ